MKKNVIHFTLKRHLVLVIFFLLGNIYLYATNSDLITQQITINLDKAGTLYDKIGSNKRYRITNLKIIGNINGTDIRLIREMAGNDVNGCQTDGKLTMLDLSESEIIDGGTYYYKTDDTQYNTIHNVIGSHMFYHCTSLAEVNIPKDIKYIDWYAFTNCTNLTSIKITENVTSIGMFTSKAAQALQM